MKSKEREITNWTKKRGVTLRDLDIMWLNYPAYESCYKSYYKALKRIARAIPREIMIEAMKEKKIIESDWEKKGEKFKLRKEK